MLAKLFLPPGLAAVIKVTAAMYFRLILPLVVMLQLAHASDIMCQKNVANVEAKKDEMVSLPCSFSDPAKYSELEVTWQWGLDAYPTVVHAQNLTAKRVELQDRRFRGRTAIPFTWNQTGNTTLTISQAQTEDSGIYTCIIRGGGRPAYCASLTLTVNSGLFRLCGGHHSVWIPFLLLVLTQVPT